MEIVKKVPWVGRVTELEAEERKVMYWYALNGCKLENKEFMGKKYEAYAKKMTKEIKPYTFEEFEIVDLKYENNKNTKQIIYWYKDKNGKRKRKYFGYTKIGLDAAVEKLRQWIFNEKQ
jgi:hypothetical protein